MKEKIVKKEIRKANLIKRSYFFNKLLIKTGAKLVNLVTNPRKEKNRRPTKYSRIVVLMRPNNTFISLVGKGIEKKTGLITKNLLTKKLVTAGFAGFHGPKRSSPYSRHIVARIMSYYVYHQGYENVDIYFNSRITRRFYFLFKGLVIKPFNVRYIARNKMVAHGYMRKKKKRRK